MRTASLWLGFLCGIWWLAFAALSPATSIQTLPLAFATLIATAVAWKWEAVGGTLLILEGVGNLMYVSSLERASLTSSILLYLTLALPPLLSGILFAVHWRRVRSSEASQ
jgi:hypothetical protein